jgi:hypothetical protein
MTIWSRNSPKSTIVGEKSIPPDDGKSRLTGARIGSVTSIRNRVIGLPPRMSIICAMKRATKRIWSRRIRIESRPIRESMAVVLLA